MDIGSKIKAARIAAELTQEQAAEALEVSRQTISNWENEKTYPDIVSVVKMSDLYGVSLDHLLKGKESASMSEYLDYLEESTNTVRSKNKWSMLLLLLTYLGIWAFALIVFWFFSAPDDALGYSLMFLLLLLPVTTLVISFLIGKNDYGGKGKWLLPVVFGVMYMLAEYATFGAANMAAFHKVNPPQYSMIPVGALLSLFGMSVGFAIRYAGKRRRKV